MSQQTETKLSNKLNDVVKSHWLYCLKAVVLHTVVENGILLMKTEVPNFDQLFCTAGRHIETV